MPDYTAPNRSDMGRNVFKGMSKKSKAKETKKEAPMAIRVGVYGRYQTKSGYVAGVYTARAFPMPPTKARGLIAEATGETEEAAIAALHSAIDARETRRSEDRRTDPSTGAQVPTSDEYVEALNTVNLTKPQRAMMMALSLAEADGLTEERVAKCRQLQIHCLSQKSARERGSNDCWISVFRDRFQGAFNGFGMEAHLLVISVIPDTKRIRGTGFCTPNFAPPSVSLLELRGLAA